MTVINAISDLIGSTPLLRFARLAPEWLVFGKCEFMNPMSLKDRPVRQIIQDAEDEGTLKPGATLIEATSGNTGMAIAYISALKGYRAILVMSEIQSLERRQILKALGAELVLTPASEGTRGAREKLKELVVEHPDYFYIGQHVNASNPRAHYLTTGPELWQDTRGEIDILVAPLGTGGTLCGAGRFLRERNREVQLVAVEPRESPFISKGIFHPHRMMGTAPGFVPDTLERELIDQFYLVSEQEAFEMCRRIARTEGLLVGISSGASTFAAIQLARQSENEGKTIVCILADTGQRYLSVEGLFD